MKNETLTDRHSEESNGRAKESPNPKMRLFRFRILWTLRTLAL